MNESTRVREQLELAKRTFRKRTSMLEPDEIAWMSKLEVVDGYYCLYCRITSVHGETFYRPMTKDSDVTIGEILDPSRIMYVDWTEPKVHGAWLREIAYLPVGS